MFFSNVGKLVQDFTVTCLDCSPNDAQRDTEL